MKHFISLFLLCIASATYSQGTYTIAGKVIDKNTRAPLQGASVFAQNTTFGMATDAGGQFRLKLPNGGYELIVTFTGYETENLRISSATAGEEMVIELSPVEKSLQEVAIVSSSEVADGWQKYGDFFKDNFIGKTEFSRQTFIKNPEVLKFYFSKRRNRLKVLAAEPLLVENFALGYTIKFAIDSFTYEYDNNTAQFIGYPLFEEMLGTADKGAVWLQNRSRAYNGSMLQFMRSVFNRNLDKDGFEVQFLVKNNGAETTLPLKDPYQALHWMKDDSTNTVAFTPNQPDIAIIYTKARPEPAFIEFDPSAKRDFQVSTLAIAKGSSIVIEENGYFFEQTDVTTNGYWGFEKVGDMLPFDYINK